METLERLLYFEHFMLMINVTSERLLFSTGCRLVGHPEPNYIKTYEQGIRDIEQKLLNLGYKSNEVTKAMSVYTKTYPS